MAKTFYSNCVPTIKCEGDTYHFVLPYEGADETQEKLFLTTSRSTAWMIARLVLSRAGEDNNETAQILEAAAQ